MDGGPPLCGIKSVHCLRGKYHFVAMYRQTSTKTLTERDIWSVTTKQIKQDLIAVLVMKSQGGSAERSPGWVGENLFFRDSWT